MERLDYGAGTKYYPNPFLGLGLQRHHKQQQHGKQQFSLVALNPHAHTLGLQAQDFTPSKLTAGLLPEDEAAAAPAAVPAAEQQSLEHQLLAAQTPALPAPDSDAVAAEDAVEDDAIATAEAEEAPEVEQQQQRQQEDWGGPAFQFIDGSSSSSEEEEEEEEELSGEEQQQQQQLSKARQAAAAADEQEEDVDEVAAEGSARRQRREAAAAAVEQEDDGVVVLISSSSSSGSSSGESEGGSEGDEQQELIGGSSEEGDVDDSFIPLLPSLNPAAANTAAAGDSDTAAAADADAAATPAAAGEGRTPGFKPPWLPRLCRFGSPLLRLHNEVVAFCRMLEPTAEEVESRARSMRTVREVVHSIWPQAEVLVFGSYETGLYTPASDTDIVVCGAGLNDPTKGLKALAHALTQRQLVRNMQQVLTARVPIIKFEMIDSGLAFDVAWDQRSGPAGAALVRQLLAAWPVMKPLVLVLKVFLTQRELNEVYAGGIGSYSLIIMVAAFLQMHASRRPAADAAAAGGSGGGSGGRKRGRSMGGADVAGALEANLGLLLVDFMRLYGRALNMSEVGVTCASGGSFYSKSAKGFLDHGRPHLLSVQDPLDAANDTARNSWNIKTVRQVFDHAYQLLTAPCAPGESLLGRIIHLAPVVAGRPIPPWFHEVPTPSGSRGRPSSSSSKQRQQQRERGRSAGGSSRSRSEHRERGRSRGDEERRKSSGGKGGGSSSEQQQRSGSKGRGGDSSSRKKQRAETPGSTRRERKKQRQQQQGGAGGSSSKSSGKGRDAAGRAGAAAGGSRQYEQQQQQQRSHGKSPGPGRKRQRR